MNIYKNFFMIFLFSLMNYAHIKMMCVLETPLERLQQVQNVQVIVYIGMGTGEQTIAIPIRIKSNGVQNAFPVKV